MIGRLIEFTSGWRSLAAAFIILSFLIFVGLLAVSGHSPHLFLAVGYLLVAAFILARIAPRDSGPTYQDDFDPDAGFRLDEESAGCGCCGASATHHQEVNQ